MDKISLSTVKTYNPESFTKRVLFKTDASVTFVLHFLPGQRLPAHRHPGSTLYLLVLEGSGELVLDQRAIPVAAEDAVMCGGEVNFSFENTGPDPVRLYVTLTRLPDERYAEER
ncbi:cupin domain-containing protein [Cohnella sp. 56]|uniref:cupin domain-containing protein n=1 Tax=Cohnella sp. 56 TaxID=3113722 RepID=UPI0030E78269